MKGLITGAALIASTVYGPSQSYTNVQTASVPAAFETVISTSTLESLTASSTVSASTTNQAFMLSTSTLKSDFKDNTGVMAYLKKAYADDPVLIQVARCESAFRQYDDKTGAILHGKANPSDIGVMQINQKYHLDEAAAMGIDITTVEGNVAFAKYLYSTQGAAPWSASQGCWSVAYKSTQTPTAGQVAQANQAILSASASQALAANLMVK